MEFKLQMWVAAFATTVVSGCASTQLNYNTLDLASTTDKLLVQQVLYNLERFIDSETAMPAQVVVTNGSATTTNSLTPSITSPLDSIAALTSNGAGVLTQKVSTKNPASATLSGSDTWSQNWSLAPITDVYQMRRLRALYRFAVDDDRQAFKARFPLLYKTSASSGSECLHDMNGGEVRAKVTAGGAIESKKSTDPKAPTDICATSATVTGGGGLAVVARTHQDTNLVLDPHYLRGPACIICDIHGKRELNPNLQAGWLRWVNLPGAQNVEERRPAPGDQSLGVFGHHELFVAREKGTNSSNSPYLSWPRRRKQMRPRPAMVLLLSRAHQVEIRAQRPVAL